MRELKSNKPRNATSELYFTYRLVRSERITGKVKQVALLNLDRHFSVAPSFWPALYVSIEKLMAGQASVEIEALLAATNQDTWIGRRDRTLLLLALQTGLRGMCLTQQGKNVTDGSAKPVRLRCALINKILRNSHMNVSPTTGIRVESSSSDVSYVLPARPSGGLRWIGLLYVVLGLALIIYVAYLLTPMLGDRFDFRNFVAHLQSSGGFWLLIFSGVLLTLTLLNGLSFMRLGILAIFGRSRVDWRDRQLSVLEYAGPVRWRRRIPLKRIRKFRVNFSVVINNEPVSDGPLAKIGVLTAEYDQDKPLILVQGYPPELLEQLAADQAWRIGASSAGKGSPEVDFREKWSPEFMDVFHKPAPAAA